MSEKRIEEAIINYIFAIGGYAFKAQSGSAMVQKGEGRFYKINFAPRGTPDIVAAIKGKFCGIEVKKDAKEVARWQRIAEAYEKTGTTAKSNLREVGQYETAKTITKAGGLFFLVSSLDDLEACLLENGKPRFNNHN